MDALKEEMKKRKEALAKARSQGSGKKKKYMRAGELRRLEEEQLDLQKEEKRKSRKRSIPAQDAKENESDKRNKGSKSDSKKKKADKKAGSEKSTPKSSEKSSSKTAAVASKDQDEKELTPRDVTNRFRELGLVVRYFGETHTRRLERLQDAREQRKKELAGLSEMEEFRLGKGFEIRNTFLEKDATKSLVNEINKAQAGRGGDGGKKDNSDDDDDEEADADDGKTQEDYSKDPPKYIYKFLKGLLQSWEKELSQRSEEASKTVQGRNDTKTLKQCKDYIRPLFKLCKKRRLEPSLEAHLMKIVTFAKEGEFVRAHDAYIDVAIGRAAWPIGVTMVGIHARSGRAKIESSTVAHVMNSELQRKYLTSVKRLLTYAQKVRTDVDPSKKVS